MKYKDLPTEALVSKLIATSFGTPSANLAVFNWYKAIEPSMRFLENERIKLVKKFGVSDGHGNYKVPDECLPDFLNDFGQVREMDIPGDAPECPVKEDWFLDEKCSYPAEKAMWLTPAEIGKILNK